MDSLGKNTQYYKGRCFNLKKWLRLILLLTIVSMLIIGCSKSATVDKEIVFADAGWDSIKFHNAVAGEIISKLYNYTWREVPGSTTVLHEGLLMNEIDIHMEVWTANIESYEEDLANGKFKDLGTNFNDNYQGIYVPRYVIEGDKERGIEALAPDLKYVWELKKYPDVFKDNENSGMGRIYGSIPGWEVDEILYNKYIHYNLDENFIYFRPGSEASLASAITSAYEKGEAVASYYWEPTWLLGKYDMVLLEDEPYNEESYKMGATSLPPVDVTIGVNNDFYQAEPEIVKFLEKYETSSQLTSEALAYMQDTGANYEETARWFILEHDELLEEWLEADDIKKLKTALDEGVKDTNINPLYKFPVNIPINLETIDNAVRDFSVKHTKFFTHISNFLSGLVNLINDLLNFIPWFVVIIFVIVIQYRITKSLTSGIFYGFLLFLIGAVGLWYLMYETLSIIIASVIISLILGFPTGILISTSDRADAIARPILDTMQTMPVFVYLIPALLFFGLGKAPAVIATTIYAIVPIIRVTNHGIRQIDKEIVEASISFGSTWFQSLVKVKIPQALPTIMTGVNQTIMMAISMVVTTSMIGATGLGMEVLIGVNRIEIGRGLVSGTAVVIIAIIMDRLTQGFVRQSEVNSNGK